MGGLATAVVGPPSGSEGLAFAIYMHAVHSSMHKTAKRVREPVQVYMEPDDKALLDQLAEETSLSRAELLRRGLRRLAADLRGARAPGGSMDLLIGALGTDADIPPDLSMRHDDYLYPAPHADGSRGD
jgi:hypothetical protein